MATSVSEFQTAFPEFAPYNLAAPAIQFWIEYAKVFLNGQVWGSEAPVGAPLAPYDYGVLFHTAHHIAVGLQNATVVGTNPATGQAIGAPGLTQGIESAKTVDKVSVSLDVGSIAEEAAGHWNATSYGRNFVRLAKQFGNAPMYVGAGFGSLQYNGAWAGPGYPFPGWFAW